MKKDGYWQSTKALVTLYLLLDIVYIALLFVPGVWSDSSRAMEGAALMLLSTVLVAYFYDARFYTNSAIRDYRRLPLRWTGIVSLIVVVAALALLQFSFSMGVSGEEFLTEFLVRFPVNLMCLSVFYCLVSSGKLFRIPLPNAVSDDEKPLS